MRPQIQRIRLGLLTLGLASMAAQAEVSVPPVPAWPDPLFVSDWLARETALARKMWQETAIEARLSNSAPTSPQVTGGPAAPPDTQKSSSKAVRARRAVELAAIYGVGTRLSSEVRIGGVLYGLQPDDGRLSASDGRGSDSIVAEGFQGDCLQLKYRQSKRRVCLTPSHEQAATGTHHDD